MRRIYPSVLLPKELLERDHDYGRRWLLHQARIAAHSPIAIILKYEEHPLSDQPGVVQCDATILVEEQPHGYSTDQHRDE